MMTKADLERQVEELQGDKSVLEDAVSTLQARVDELEALGTTPVGSAPDGAGTSGVLKGGIAQQIAEWMTTAHGNKWRGGPLTADRVTSVDYKTDRVVFSIRHEVPQKQYGIMYKPGTEVLVDPPVHEHVFRFRGNPTATCTCGVPKDS